MDRHIDGRDSANQSGTGSSATRARYADRVVDCDATHDMATGVGFVAVTGALGQHVRRVECADSTTAEALAILFAMSLVDSRRPFIFRTDCEPVATGCQPGVKANRNRRLGSVLARIKVNLRHRLQWEIQHVDREKVRASHRLAARARQTHLHGSPFPLVDDDIELWAPA